MGKKYIVREFKTKDTEAYKSNEIKMAKMLSDKGFSPKFLGNPSNNEFYIIEFIDRSLKDSDLTNLTTLFNLGLALRKVHNHKFSKKGKSQLDRIKKYFRKMCKMGIAVPDGFFEAVDQWIKTSPKLETKSGFCHGDLNPSNIRIREDGSIVFVNWVNAGNSNTYEDVGHLIQTYGLSDNQINTFLEGYLGRKPTEIDINRAKLFAKRTCLLTAVVWFSFSENSNDRKMPLKDRSKKINDIVKSETLITQKEFAKKGNIPNVKYGNKDEVKIYAASAWKEYKNSMLPKGVLEKITEWVASLLK
jgi:serine/threonine protein kinase